MVFDDLFQRFLEAAPACVMHRALMENIFAPEKLDEVFHQAAEKQYERELLFSTLVDLTSQVVCRASAGVRTAYLSQRERITVSLTSVYNKLQGVELETSRALVQHTARQVGELIQRCKGSRKSLLPGYRVRILDGNHIRKTQHRLKVLRGTSAGAPRPGKRWCCSTPAIDGARRCWIPCTRTRTPRNAALGWSRFCRRSNDTIAVSTTAASARVGFLFGLAGSQGLLALTRLTWSECPLPWKSLGKAR